MKRHHRPSVEEMTDTTDICPSRQILLHRVVLPKLNIKHPDILPLQVPRHHVIDLMSSPADLSSLVRELYQSSDPARISEVQRQLQDVQRSYDGWALAEHLLQSDETNTRFFGALTYTVKINQDGSDLNEQDLLALLDKLLDHFVQMVQRRESNLVLTKICSTLVNFFLISHSPWQRCIRHLMCCLQYGQVLPEEVQGSASQTSQLVTLLKDDDLLAILLFAKTLAEDVAKIDHTSQIFSYCEKRIQLNMNDICDVLRHAMKFESGIAVSIRSAALATYQRWVVYAAGDLSPASDHWDTLRQLLLPTIQYLLDESTFEPAAELLTDVFLSNEVFLTADAADSFAALLDSEWCLKHLQDLAVAIETEESSTFAQLVLAFGQTTAKKLLKSPQSAMQIMNIFHQITVTQNHVTVDQALSNAVVDFWEKYVAEADDIRTASPLDDIALGIASYHWLHAIEELCNATQLPFGVNGFEQVSNEDALAEFRLRVRDAVQDSYGTFGVAVLNKLTSVALAVDLDTDHAHSHVSPWPALDAVFNCFEGLAGSMEYHSSVIDQHEEEDRILRNLFGSPLFAALTDPKRDTPMKLRRRVVRMLGDHDGFLGRHPTYLLSAFGVLLEYLANPLCMDHAARAISKLCDVNRKVLVPRFDFLLSVMEQFFPFDGADSIAKEKIAGAVACVAQALSNEDLKQAALSRILQVVEADFRKQSHSLLSTTDFTLQDVICDTIMQLEAVGAAFKTPDDVPVDLEDGLDQSTFWTDGPGGKTQANLVAFLQSLVKEFPEDGRILEAACKVVKTGYHELQPGPFVFRPEVTVDVVTRVPAKNPRLDFALSTAAAFVTSRVSKDPGADSAVTALVAHVCRVIEHLQNPDGDPELAYSATDFIARLLRSHLKQVATLPFSAVVGIFEFSTACLDGTNALPKRSGAKVWTTLLTAKSSVSPARDLVLQIVDSMAPTLIKALVRNFGGKASRSHLEWLCEPFRHLIFMYPQARRLLEESLTSSDFPSTRVDDKAKRKFLLAVCSLRGDKKTNSVVRDFWLECRGMPLGYG